MRRHRVAQPVLANHQPLIRRAAQNAGEPLRVFQSEDAGGREKRQPGEMMVWIAETFSNGELNRPGPEQ